RLLLEELLLPLRGGRDVVREGHRGFDESFRGRHRLDDRAGSLVTVRVGLDRGDDELASGRGRCDSAVSRGQLDHAGLEGGFSGAVDLPGSVLAEAVLTREELFPGGVL